MDKQQHTCGWKIPQGITIAQASPYPASLDVLITCPVCQGKIILSVETGGEA